ncbi:MAG: hypothetical protein AAF636_12350 [Pseudomonadota bacterium]
MISYKSIIAAAVFVTLPVASFAQSEIDQDQLSALIGDVDAEQAEAFGADVFENEVLTVQAGTYSATGGATLATAELVDAEQAEALNRSASAPAAGGGRVGYVWANSPTSASYTPSATYAFNASGGQVTITRSSTGTYAVRFAGLGGPRAGGNVQVTGYGSDTADCKVRWWSSGGADFIANIRCLAPNGAAVDARYTVLVTRRS